ncbi:hypothetical protein PLESTB_001369900 [Pleodorina starrii]|uniref:SAM domain-containing protein n=1 Tax=Pleodorina starrii TaxID=330485 RepID=A0A9W6BUA4_9CHLO|nr:hypothetical protein PLESTB_001369900 [Pleodorina starrii]
MSGVSDDDNDDFVPVQSKRRRVTASQPPRKQRITSPPVPSRVQGAVLPKTSVSQPVNSRGQHEEPGGRQAKLPVAIQLQATARTPLRSLPTGAATPGNAARTTGTGDLPATAAGPAPNTSEVLLGTGTWKGASRLSCTPAAPEPSSGWDSAAAGTGGSLHPATSLPPPGAAAPVTAPAGPWRRNSEPRPSRLAGRRSDGSHGQDQWEPRAPSAPAAASQPHPHPHHPTAAPASAPAIALTAAMTTPAAPQPLPRSRPPPWAMPAAAAAAAAPRSASPCGSRRATAAAAARTATALHCPVCGCDLAQVSDTATGREAHVNACLDGGGGDAVRPDGAPRGEGDADAEMPPRGRAGRGTSSAAAADGATVMEVELLESDDGDDSDDDVVEMTETGTGEGLGAAAAAAAAPTALAEGADAAVGVLAAGAYTAAKAAAAAETRSAGVAEAGCGSSGGGADETVAAAVAQADPDDADEGPAAEVENEAEGIRDDDDEDDFLWPLAAQVPPEMGSLPPRHAFDGADPLPAACDDLGGGDLDLEGEDAGLGPDGPECEGDAAADEVVAEPYKDVDAEPRDDGSPGPYEYDDGHPEPYNDEDDGAAGCVVQAGEEAGEEGDPEEDDDPVAAWLCRHGLQRWLPRFRDGEVDEAVVPELNDSDLQGLGIDSPRSRAAILAAARDFGAPLPAPAPRAAAGAAAHQQDAPAWACRTGAAPPTTTHAHGPQPQSAFPDMHAAALRPAHEYPTQQQHQLQHQQQDQHLQGEQQQRRQQPLQQQQQQHQARANGFAPPCAASASRTQGPRAPVPAQGSVQPFSSMFLAKPSGPVRITSFFRGPAAAAGASGPAPDDPATAATAAAAAAKAGGPGAAAGGAGPQPRAFWGRAVQQRPHPAIVPDEQAAAHPHPQQQLQPAARRQQQQRPQPGAVAAATAAGGGAGGGPAGRLPRWVPECHTIPGTRMLVDYFGPPSKGIPAATSPFRILTHFHADHYKGLTRSFAGGTVLASPVTARLVSERLKLPAARLQVLPMDTPVEVDGVSLTLVDANHCPGAAMVVAQPRGGWPPVLHTGDCRLGEHMRSHPALQALVGRRCTLVLDTTYCDPRYEFPPQKAVLDAVMEAVKAESFNKRALFVFGTYTIGKERLFLEVAAALGQKVYCSKEKAATLAACGLAPRYASLITTNHLEASIHAVPLFKVTLDGLSAILQQYRGRYSAVIGFSPTGWNHTGGPRGGGGRGGAGDSNGGRSGGGRGGRGGGGRGGRGGGGGPSVLSRQQQSAVIGRRMARGTAVVYQVPYSEHSSFGELRSFVSWLQPGRIVPSVNADGPAGPKTRRMLQLLLGPEHAPSAAAAAAAGTAGAGGAGNAAAARRDIRNFMRGGSGGGGRADGAGATAKGPAAVAAAAAVGGADGNAT